MVLSIKSHSFKRQEQNHHYNILAKQNIFAGKGLTHVQPCSSLRMSKKEASLVKCCLPYQPVLPR